MTPEALVTLFLVAIPFIVVFAVLFDVVEFNPFRALADRRRQRSEQGLPIHERLARAAERAAERSLKMGWISQAEEEFAKAHAYRQDYEHQLRNGIASPHPAHQEKKATLPPAIELDREETYIRFPWPWRL